MVEVWSRGRIRVELEKAKEECALLDEIAGLDCGAEEKVSAMLSHGILRVEDIVRK